MSDLIKTFDDLLDAFGIEIRQAFVAAVRDVTDNAIIKDITIAIEAGNFQQAFRLLGFTDAAMRPLTAAIERAFESGGIFIGNTFPKVLNTPNGRAVFRFDVRNQRAENWLRDNSSSLITKLKEETRNNVRTTLETGMRDGRNPRSMALDIAGRFNRSTGQREGGIVGLTENQTMWVESARNKLSNLDKRYFDMELRDKRFDGTVARAIADGKPLPQSVVDKLVGRYKDNALKFRAEAISRTEALSSLNRSDYEATKQAVEMGAVKDDTVQREWDDVGDRVTRNTHREMNGQRVGLDEPFVSTSGALLLHPGDTSLGAGADEVVSCRCRVKSVIDWLADID